LDRVRRHGRGAGSGVSEGRGAPAATAAVAAAATTAAAASAEDRDELFAKHAPTERVQQEVDGESGDVIRRERT